MTDQRKDILLDDFFAAARDEAPLPSGDFLLEMQELALAEQPKPVVPRPVARQRGPLSQLWATIGGWPAVAGLAATAVTGVWIGSVSPAAMESDLATWMTGSSSLFDEAESLVDPLTGYEFAMIEG